MYSQKINVRNQALYFDGSKLWFGEIQKNSAGRLFFNRENCFGVYLNDENTNVDFKLHKPSVMILKEAIEQNAYGEDRNYGLENASLDESENQFINLLYKKGKVDYLEFYKSIEILGAKIEARLRNAEAQQMFATQFASLAKEESLENEQ